MLPQFAIISPVLRHRNQIDRAVCDIAGRPLVLFHKRGISLVEDDHASCPELLRSLCAGPVIELQDENWEWCNADPRDFNCHAMAIGSGVGLTPEYWLEGCASASTLFENPAQVMLDVYYQKLNEQIADNDVFVLRDSKTDGLVHSGFLRNVDGINLAVSKFGEGPVCLTSFELLSSVYQGRFDQVQWYRRNDEAGYPNSELTWQDSHFGSAPGMAAPKFLNRNSKRPIVADKAV